jgi:uncharacterized surface protein with fasciclin (FAS1) repeats
MQLQNNNLMKSMIKSITSIFVMCLGGIFATGCDSDVFNIDSNPYNNNSYLSNSNIPISTYLSQNEDFSEWTKVLNYSNLYNALNQSSSGVSFTAFAPTNEAVQAFYKKKGVNKVEDLGYDYARAMILYHTVKDSILPADFITKSYVDNLNGDRVYITIDSTNAGRAILNKEAQITKMGITAYNGKIYILSSMMTPLVETITDRINQNTSAKIMAAAVKETGLDKMLDVITDTTIVDGKQTINSHYYTFLNVSDATFANAGITNVETLKAKLKALETNSSVSEDSLLRKYVKYHILGSSYTTNNLGTMQGSDTTRIWNTEAMDQVLTVTFDSLSADKYTINNLGESAEFVMANSDILCKNGYMHEINGWLPVWEPKQSTVVWDFADYSEVKSAVGMDYQPTEPVASEQKYNIAKLTCYTSEIGESDTRNNTYHYIDYVTCKSNLKAAVNYDRVVFNIGYMGSVEMKTPTIVKGKYKAVLSFIYLTDHSFMRQMTDGNGGLMKMTIDDANTIYTAPYTTVTSAFAGVYQATLYDQIEFNETSSHTFKFVVLDPAASTNSKFSLQLDCITFIPIE